MVISIYLINLSAVYAGNNDSLPSHGYSGNADENWTYTQHHSGMRISIYWAPNSTAFESGNSVIQVGNTTDITKTGPRYKVERYTDYSIYRYMNRDDMDGGRQYKSKLDIQEPYTWVGKGEVYNEDGQDIVESMPDVWTGTKAQWDNWFEGPIDSKTGEKAYKNIPEIAELCGAEITIGDFKNGLLDVNGYKDKGVYKIFFEPLIYPIADDVSMVMTLRDLIRWEEAFQAGRLATSDGKNLLTQIAPVYVFTANAQFLIDDEPAICMVANKNPVYHVEYQGGTAAREEIRRQIRKGGKIYGSMGVGVITPEPEQVTANADFDILYNNETATDRIVRTGTSAEQEPEQTDEQGHEIALHYRLIDSTYKPEDIAKVEYYTLDNHIVPGDMAAKPGKLAATVSDPAVVPAASIKVDAGPGTGEKTVIGMKMYFRDGTAFPSSDGETYEDQYVIHHITLIEDEPVPEANDDDTEPHAGAVIKADQRDNERFDVTKGIPSGETLYVNVLADEYIYRFIPRRVTGTVEYDVRVEYEVRVRVSDGEDNGDDDDEDGEEDKNSEGREDNNDSEDGENPEEDEENTEEEDEPRYETRTRHATYTFTRSYSYWEVDSLEVYGIAEAVVSNGALPGGRVILAPSDAYSPPNVVYDDISDHLEPGDTSITTSSSSSGSGALYDAALRAVPSPVVRNDLLVINGKAILSDNDYSSNAPGPNYSKLGPSPISRDALYANNLEIPETTANGLHESNGTITYERVFSLNPAGQENITLPIPNINPVFVHTPVYVEMTVSSDDSHNQKPDPKEGASALVLARPFELDVTNSGAHRNIKGYGNRDYTGYIKDREVRFGFDAYLGTDMGGVYLKAGVWHSLGELGISSHEDKLLFSTTAWVDEGLYHAEIRSIAVNDGSDGENAENKANLNPSNTAAYISKPVEISGRVYDLAVTDIDDVAWELFFRKNHGEAEPTGKVFWTGPRNINGDIDAQRKYIFPIMPGKNDVQGYGQLAVKLGYAVKFELKTMGNYYDKYDFVQINPTFAFVDRDGGNRRGVDLYYSTPQNPLVRIGSGKDTLQHAVKLDFEFRGIDPEEFAGTADAMYRLRGGIGNFTIDRWRKGFPEISRNGVVMYKYDKILLSEPVRSFAGPRSVPGGVDKDRAFASVQKWYGEYRLPADCLAVPEGTDLSKQRNLTRNSPIFLKDGYIIVSFNDISVINDDDFGDPSLRYTGKTGDGWALEEYDTDQGGWQLLKGDVLAYYADRRATDDFQGTGTH